MVVLVVVAMEWLLLLPTEVLELRIRVVMVVLVTTQATRNQAVVVAVQAVLVEMAHKALVVMVEQVLHQALLVLL